MKSKLKYDGGLTLGLWVVKTYSFDFGPVGGVSVLLVRVKLSQTELGIRRLFGVVLSLNTNIKGETGRAA